MMAILRAMASTRHATCDYCLPRFDSVNFGLFNWLIYPSEHGLILLGSSPIFGCRVQTRVARMALLSSLPRSGLG
jgi:hypothetical protein